MACGAQPRELEQPDAGRRVLWTGNEDPAHAPQNQTANDERAPTAAPSAQGRLKESG